MESFSVRYFNIDDGEELESGLAADQLEQDQFRYLLRRAIAYLRRIAKKLIVGTSGDSDEHESTAASIEIASGLRRTDPSALSPTGRKRDVRAEFQWGSKWDEPSGGRSSEVPQILYEVTQAFQRLRRKSDIAFWYYEDVAEHYQIALRYPLQAQMRKLLDALRVLQTAQAQVLRSRKDKEKARDAKQAEPSTPQASGSPLEESPADPALPGLDACQFDDASLTEHERALKFGSGSLIQLRDGLLEVAHALGMVRWVPRPGQTGMTPRVEHVPEAAVLTAKLFGLKTDVAGLDDLLGGGLVLQTPLGRQDRQGIESRRGVLGVIRGRFGSGKSTLAAQLAMEMARKGGAGVLIVLEQSVQEVLAQGYHYGWLPADRPFKLFYDGGKYEHGTPEEAFEEYVGRETNDHRGVLYIHHPEDARMSRFQQQLDSIASIKGLRPDRSRYPFRFIVADPLDAVQLSAKDAAQPGPSQHVRNRTEQILREVNAQGFTLWLTTSDETYGDKAGIYEFLPNIGDVVIRMSTMAGGEARARKDINDPPLRLVELEKVRTQPFAAGVHPFEITSRAGVRIYPTGDAVTRFVTWVDNSVRTDGVDEKISLGVAALDLALGIGGVRPESVTTLMGPTGCAKTELALLYLLQGWNASDRKDGERSLFIAFRDTWQSVLEILEGPVGWQLRFNPKDPEHYKQVETVLDVVVVDVGNVPSGQVFEQIRSAFRNRPHGVRYRRVVVDNVAYMDLTSRLVREDEAFVPNLLTLLKRERATPLFITSLVEGVVSESRVQTQIRDASHNLIVLKRNRHHTHHFIALQIRKSQKLLHAPQPLEVCIREERGGFRPRDDEKYLRPDLVRERIWSLLLGPRSKKRSVPAKGRQTWFDDFCQKLVYDTGQSFVSLGLESKLLVHERDENESAREERLPWYTSALNIRLKSVGRFLLPPDGGHSEVPAGKEHYVLRTEIADFVHRAYVQICRENDLDPLTLPPPVPQEHEEASGLQGTLDEWRTQYREIMDVLELQRGLCVRLHTLDDYDQPMGEQKLERIGAVRVLPLRGRDATPGRAKEEVSP